MKELAVIIPIYNEEKTMETVVDSCILEMNTLNINYDIFLYNDGSTDNTFKVLEMLSNKYSNVFTINKENSGHGPTILEAYKSKSKEYNWIFQIDSDNEMPIEYFKKLWAERDRYDFLIGKREGRTQQLPRKILSAASKICITLFYGRGAKDVNSPYRLMRSDRFRDLFNKMPSNTFVPNVIISGYVALKKIPFFEVSIPFTPRKFGVASINLFNIINTALKSFIQTILFRFYL